MDLVYIVKVGDKNEDLRYSLRSVAKFVPHDKIWIVGYKPKWVTNVNYLPVSQSGNKWQNSVNNILAACNCKDISDDFVLMNDDFFAIKPIDDLKESINVCLGLLDTTIASYNGKKANSPWKKGFFYVDSLLKQLKIEGPYYNYESHTPLLINKTNYLTVMKLKLVQDFMKTNKVLHKRSLYRNIDKINSKTLLTDVKINTDRDVSNKSKICDWLSVFDNQVGNISYSNLNSLLYNLFPDRCEYEIEKKKIKKKKDMFSF